MSLEQRLGELAVEWPETPDVAARVRARLEAEPARRPPLRRRLAISLAALVVLLGGVMAVPSARSTVLDWLGLDGVTIERVPETPTPAPTTRFELGAPEPLAESMVVPEELGRPDGVYRDGEIVTFLYRPETLFTQFPGRTHPELMRKLAGPGTTIERVTVDGEPGYWLAGAPHTLLYEHPTGGIREVPARLVGNTLVWQRGELTLRLEADVTKERALAIARSVQ